MKYSVLIGLMGEFMNYCAKISLFRSYVEVKPVMSITVEEFCGNVLSGEYSTEAARVKAGKKHIKKHLPAVTISGEFSQRNGGGLIAHSGFICIDIDSGDNPTISDWEALRETLGTWSEVLFSALSISGAGVFLIIPLAYPNQHRQQFLALERDFKALGITIDKACKDITRLRGVSSDVNAIWNKNAVPYNKRVIETPAYFKPIKATPEIGRLIDWTERTHGAFEKGNRNNFITQLAAACNRYNIQVNEVKACCLSYQQPTFKANEILSIIKSVYKNKKWNGLAYR